ncbi:sodium:solute symporter family protein [Heyndrickxia oleronia]|jgi:SSS family solute:Na+ symporter|uniref:sodium:solute symporter family protein n=1 Tax=Heyndrickxia TaxID=2837504 RepID=UPI00039FD076|nr:sodium:solute symporter family protein [Heyndrickxia oleronia]MCM3456878.1 sodium:solute symporter family protein [Heyndrickxia oleronia]NYV64818.1 sodium:solute symporter family protein [Bacillus sp. Gen3]OJH19315.1 sodium:solute symporter [Bacillus obstructivus]
MPGWQIALIMMVGYLVIALIVGVMAGRGRDGSSLDEFAVAGGKLSLFVMWFLMGGAVFSAFSFLGAPGWAYSKGAPSLYIIAYTAFAILPWYIIGPKVGKIGKKNRYYTISAFLKGRYNSPLLAILIGVIALFASVQYLATQMSGMALIFDVMTEGRIPFWLGALISYGIVVIYVATGGLRAAAWSDVFQGLLMIIVSWVVGLSIVHQLHGGTTEMFAKIAKESPAFLQIGKDGSNMGTVAYSTTILVSVIGFLMWPHLFTKSYASNSRTIKKTVLAYPIFALFLVPLLLVGFAAVGVVDSEKIANPDQILPYLITTIMNLPGWVYGLVGAGALAAAMSTADAITHSASLEVTDGVIKNIWKHISDKNTLLIMRLGVFVIGALSYYITVFGGQGLVALLLGAYGSIVQFAPAVYSALYWRRATASGVISGLIVGTIVNYYFQLVATTTPFEIHAGILGLIANIVVMVIVCYATKPQLEAAKNYVDAA